MFLFESDCTVYTNLSSPILCAFLIIPTALLVVYDFIPHWLILIDNTIHMHTGCYVGSETNAKIRDGRINEHKINKLQMHKIND